MKPSAYSKTDLEAGTVVEDRDQVKVTFAGGNVWHIQAEGTDEGEHETRRGGSNAWKRAEELRAELNPGYSGPPSAGDETSGPSGDDNSNEPAKEAQASEAKPPKGQEAKDGAPAEGREIMIGHIQGVQQMVPVSVVEELLADQASRVALLRGSDEARRLQRRVGATDGRCAPIFLTRKDIYDRDEEPKLFDGLFTLAACLNLEMADVAVVILPSREAHEVQSQVAAMMRSNLSAPEVAEGDELFYRGDRS